jgi:hypothetical protein
MFLFYFHQPIFGCFDIVKVFERLARERRQQIGEFAFHARDTQHGCFKNVVFCRSGGGVHRREQIAPDVSVAHIGQHEH